MQYEVLALALSILASAILAVWQLRETTKAIKESFGEVAGALERAVERVTTAIHNDIKASQQKLERRLGEG